MAGPADLADMPILAEALQALPNQIITADFVPVIGGPWQENQCAICNEDYKDGDVITLFPCGHYIHEAGVQRTFRAVQPLCPLCRASIFDETTAEKVREEHRDIVGGYGGHLDPDLEDDEPEFAEIVPDFALEHPLQRVAWEARSVMRELEQDQQWAIEGRFYEPLGQDDFVERMGGFIFRLDQAVKRLQNKYLSGNEDLMREVNESLDVLQVALLRNRASWATFSRDLYHALCVIAAADGTPYPDVETMADDFDDPRGELDMDEGTRELSYHGDGASATEMDDPSE